MESLSIVKPIKDKSGKRVKKGTYVHCNRFNGTKSDRKYWSKVHPRAYVDFYKSDCWYHAKAYKCSSIGKMTKCDGLNVRKKELKIARHGKVNLNIRIGLKQLGIEIK